MTDYFLPISLSKFLVEAKKTQEGVAVTHYIDSPSVAVNPFLTIYAQHCHTRLSPIRNLPLSIYELLKSSIFSQVPKQAKVLAGYWLLSQIRPCDTCLSHLFCFTFESESAA